MKFLTLEKHCNPNQRDIRKNTPLHTAAKYGHLQVVQFFVEGLKCPPNIRGQHNATPRHWAVTRGHHNVAQYLIDELAASSLLNLEVFYPLFGCILGIHPYMCWFSFQTLYAQSHFSDHFSDQSENKAEYIIFVLIEQ